jgi:hypothetical protein
MNEVKEMYSRGPTRKSYGIWFPKHVEERKPIFDDDKHLPSLT